MDSQRSLSEEEDSSIVSAVIVFSVAAFIGNFGVAVTGFGMAIIFLFVYTIADLLQLVECSKCDLRDAVFFQTLALGAAVPLMLYKSRDIIKTYRSKELLITFIPATVVGTPIGNFLQDHLPSNILRTIVGALITCIIFYELKKLLPASKIAQLCSRTEMKEEEEEEGGEDDDDKLSTAADHSGSKTRISFPIKKMNDEENALAPINSKMEPIGENWTAHNEDSEDSNIISNSNNEIMKNDDIAVDESNSKSENIPTGWKLRIWGFTLGLLSGFLGGLMGVRGPPLMVFFLIFSYPKNIVRANAVLILLVNVSIRVVYYIIEDLSGSGGGGEENTAWFEPSYTVLYICVVVFGMLGVPIGNYVATKLNQQQFKLVVAFLLLFSGLSNLIKGSINLANE